MKPWPHFFHADPSPPQPGDWSWHTIAQMQQEFWRRWLDAGRNWVAWWTPELPTMPWPPAGQVAPPQDEPGTVLPSPVAADRPVRARRTPTQRAAGVSAAKKTAGRSAGKGQRHH